MLTVLDWGNATSISGCGFWRGAARKFYTFTKRLMGGAPRTYACIRTSKSGNSFNSKVGRWRSTKGSVAICKVTAGWFAVRTFYNCRYYFWAEKLSLCRNCASNNLPAIQCLLNETTGYWSQYLLHAKQVLYHHLRAKSHFPHATMLSPAHLQQRGFFLSKRQHPVYNTLHFALFILQYSNTVTILHIREDGELGLKALK